MKQASSETLNPTTLAKLEIGLRTDAHQLVELEENLLRTLRRARDLGTEFGSPGDWSNAWRHQWDRVEAILQRIRERVHEMEHSIHSNEPGRLTDAMAAWKALQADDEELLDALAALREQAVGLNVGAQDEWKDMAPLMEEHLERIHACAHSLLWKLELLRVHSREEVDDIVTNILKGQPLRLEENAQESGEKAKAYVQAEKELGKEHHTYLGVMDIIKGMFLWVENPEERVQKKEQPEVTQTV
ncbi:MAG: hypothetical protein V4662_15535 [Verrucomicrobiota bacterium]